VIVGFVDIGGIVDHHLFTFHSLFVCLMVLNATFNNISKSFICFDILFIYVDNYTSISTIVA
jgi:hypothetical protein